MDQKAKDYIAEYNREEGKQSNSRDLWQRTGDAIYPYVQINREQTPGTNLTVNIPDISPMIAMKKMVAGFKQVLFPAGQTVFAIKVDSRLGNNDRVQRYLSYLTEIAHEAIFASNFGTKLDEFITHLICFGPACMFREWKKGKGLNYKTAKIGSYVIFEDDSENVIGSAHKFKMTAQQAYALYQEQAGPCIVKAMDKMETMQNEFWFLYRVMPRKINPKLPKTYNKNMPYEACVVNIADNHTVEEGGFPDNPYSICRWSRPEYEKDGRGVGTEVLPQINYLFELARKFKECANKWVDPARQAKINGVEGEVRTGPGALNWVEEMDNIRSLDNALNGNFPISEKTLDRQTALIKEAFYNNAFDPLQELTGDRRTTLEIQERIRGTLKHLGPPVGRIWGEGLTPVLSGSIMDLIRNHAVEQPPPELGGVSFRLEYVGPLAMALKSEQARGFQAFVNFVGAVNAAFPDQYVADNLDFDDAMPRIGRTFGVNIEDVATAEERTAKRQARQQQMEQQQMLAAAQTASKSYKDASGAAEEGSPAEALMAGAGK
jgi:hypothetical protein